MSWKIKITHKWTDKMRFGVRAVLFLNALILAVASVWLTGKTIWFLVRFLNRTIFSTPW